MLEDNPQDIGPFDVLLMPLLFVFIGVVIYILAFNRMRLGEKANWKWASMLPLGIGLYFGLMWVLKLRDSIYRLALVGGKIVFMHWLAFILPLLAIAAVIAIEFFRGRNFSAYGKGR